MYSQSRPTWPAHSAALRSNQRGIAMLTGIPVAACPEPCTWRSDLKCCQEAGQRACVCTKEAMRAEGIDESQCPEVDPKCQVTGIDRRGCPVCLIHGVMAPIRPTGGGLPIPAVTLPPAPLPDPPRPNLNDPCDYPRCTREDARNIGVCARACAARRAAQRPFPKSAPTLPPELASQQPQLGQMGLAAANPLLAAAFPTGGLASQQPQVGQMGIASNPRGRGGRGGRHGRHGGFFPSRFARSWGWPYPYYYPYPYYSYPWPYPYYQGYPTYGYPWLYPFGYGFYTPWWGSGWGGRGGSGPTSAGLIAGPGGSSPTSSAPIAGSGGSAPVKNATPGARVTTLQRRRNKKSLERRIKDRINRFFNAA